MADRGVQAVDRDRLRRPDTAARIQMQHYEMLPVRVPDQTGQKAAGILRAGDSHSRLRDLCGEFGGQKRT
ncbi:MAG: hypothetical protein Q8R92_03850 [Deltaproteobacteria bacterium]|nr:hypothetical protein [Deltaproteobacteria bacterium]